MLFWTIFMQRSQDVGRNYNTNFILVLTLGFAHKQLISTVKMQFNRPRDSLVFVRTWKKKSSIAAWINDEHKRGSS